MDLYKIAKNSAKIILKESWSTRGIVDVGLYGSLARGEKKANDIDLIILHESPMAPDFSDYWEDWAEDMKDHPEKDMHRSAYYLWVLGAEHPKKDPACVKIIKMINSPEIKSVTDLDKILDVNIMSINLFPAMINKEANFESMVYCGHYDEDYVKSYNERINQRRCLAIASCKDLSFWNTILKECKLYNPETKDFSIPLETKYPGTVEAFKAGDTFEMLKSALAALKEDRHLKHDCTELEDRLLKQYNLLEEDLAKSLISE